MTFYLCLSNNGTTCFRHQCRKTTAIGCHRYLISTGFKKNEQHLNIDQNFDHHMSLSKNKCWYSNNCLHFLNCAVPMNFKFLFFTRRRCYTRWRRRRRSRLVLDDLSEHVALAVKPAPSLTLFLNAVKMQKKFHFIFVK